jgi:hypothetical protein
VIWVFGKSEYFFEEGLTRWPQNGLTGKSVEPRAEARLAIEELRIDCAAESGKNRDDTVIP